MSRSAIRAVAGGAALLIAGGAVAAKMVVTPRFSFPLPPGYRDITAKLARRGVVGVEAKQVVRGYRPTIVVQEVPIAGGSQADPAICAQTGKGMAGTNWKLDRATIIDGPIGKTCQMRIVAPAGVAIITELNLANAAGVPETTWLMTCNHADGDAAGERVCQQTLAGFKLTR